MHEGMQTQQCWSSCKELRHGLPKTRCQSQPGAPDSPVELCVPQDIYERPVVICGMPCDYGLKTCRLPTHNFGTRSASLQQMQHSRVFTSNAETLSRLQAHFRTLKALRSTNRTSSTTIRHPSATWAVFNILVPGTHPRFSPCMLPHEVK